jgi:hypothetical protein
MPGDATMFWNSLLTVTRGSGKNRIYYIEGKSFAVRKYLRTEAFQWKENLERGKWLTRPPSKMTSW